MKSKAPEISELRREMIRILQFMNKYQLREFEYSDKNSPESIRISRPESEASSPLLEGKSVSVPGQIYASDVGFISWECREDQQVEEGELLGVIKKQDREIEISAPFTGVVEFLTGSEKVEFGERIAQINAVSEEEDQ
ncbi:MAG: biotin/lipoyl-containing protein [bacterium]